MPITPAVQDPNARAVNAAQVKYGASQAQLERAIQALAGQRAADEAGIQTYGNAGRQGITQSFDQLAGNLETNRQLVNRDLGIQTESVGQGYRDANQIAELARQTASDRLKASAANNSAYATADLATSLSPLEALASRITGENAQSDATYTGNLKNWAAQQDALMRAGQAGAERDRANQLSSFENSLLKELAASKAKFADQEYGYQGSLLDLLNERGAFQYGAAMDYADQGFNQMLQAAQYNLGEQEQADNAAYRQAQLAQSAQEFAARQALAERAQNYTESQVNNDDYWKQLDYELKRDSLDAENSRYGRQQSLAESSWLAEQAQRELDQKNKLAEYLSNGGDPNILYDLGIQADPRPGQGAARLGAGLHDTLIAQLSGGSNGGGGLSVGSLNPVGANRYTPVDWLLAGRDPSAALRILNRARQ